MLTYKTVSTRTLKGLQRAERLQADGWRVISSAVTGAVLMEKNTATCPHGCPKDAHDGHNHPHCDVCVPYFDSLKIKKL